MGYQYFLHVFLLFRYTQNDLENLIKNMIHNSNGNGNSNLSFCLPTRHETS